MSRIGKEPVKVPAGATVSVKDGVVAVKGPKGELKYALPPGIECKVEDGVARFTRGSDDRRARAFHGLARALVANMVEGVVKGYAKALDIAIQMLCNNQAGMLDSLTNEGHLKLSLKGVIFFIIKFLAPVAIAIIFIKGLF